jgi:hypothetical protein
MFNPDELALAVGQINLSFTVNSRRLSIQLNRPEGDMYAVLVACVAKVCAESERLIKTDALLRQYNFQLILLGVAARERAMPPEAVQLVELKLARWMPIIDNCWRLLELFRAVARFADSSRIELPEILRDDRQAWGASILREVDAIECDSSSKNAYVKLLRASVKALKSNQNPFNATDEPELCALIDCAFQLKYWDCDIGDAEAKLPNHKRATAGQLRRDISQKLNAYRVSLTTLASYIDKAPSVLWSKVGKDGNFYWIGDKGARIQVGVHGTKLISTDPTRSNFRK